MMLQMLGGRARRAVLVRLLRLYDVDDGRQHDGGIDAARGLHDGGDGAVDLPAAGDAVRRLRPLLLEQFSARPARSPSPSPRRPSLSRLDSSAMLRANASGVHRDGCLDRYSGQSCSFNVATICVGCSQSNIDCSGASDEFCSSLNRQSCSLIEYMRRL